MHTEWEITPELAPSLGVIQGESSKCYLEFGNMLNIYVLTPPDLGIFGFEDQWNKLILGIIRPTFR